MPNATLNSFSDLCLGKSSQIRNCANEHEMRAWFEALFLEKFDGQDERAQKAWAWCSTVGRKHMLREGASEPFHPSRDVLASGPRWIRDAIEAGKPLSALSLAPCERDLFSSILDWMRSPSGPSLTSDWSKISTPQAKAAELAWIDAMAKAAAKKDLEAADAAGTELFAPLGAEGQLGCLGSGPEWAGWRWVEVKSADALDREGALMRHCVGSYAADVASEKKRIYSLRDPSNAPKLTVEAEGAALVQIKAFANASCPAEMRPAVACFAKAFEADVAARGLGEASASDDLSVAGVSFLPGLGLASVVLSARQAELLRGWAKAAETGGKDARKRLNTLLPKLAGMGLAAELAMTLRFSVSESRSQALVEAASNGHAECVKLLIPVSDPKDDNSKALREAAFSGQTDTVKLLLSVSDPAADESFALRWAMAGRHIECVKLLIPFSDSKALSAALCNAARFGSDESVKLLLSVLRLKWDMKH